jgi:hypothetical protein
MDDSIFNIALIAVNSPDQSTLRAACAVRLSDDVCMYLVFILRAGLHARLLQHETRQAIETLEVDGRRQFWFQPT